MAGLEVLAQPLWTASFGLPAWLSKGAPKGENSRDLIELDIKSFFDSVNHELVLRAVRRHTDERWILLDVERWLKAPLQQEDGTLVQRDRGRAQGSSICPLLANLFLHYPFDVWMEKRLPDAPFERHSDDG